MTIEATIKPAKIHKSFSFLSQRIAKAFYRAIKGVRELFTSLLLDVPVAGSIRQARWLRSLDMAAASLCTLRTRTTRIRTPRQQLSRTSLRASARATSTITHAHKINAGEHKNVVDCRTCDKNEFITFNYPTISPFVEDSGWLSASRLSGQSVN